ncbi:hypothetical protein RBSH_02546 [Rhodopirellula baltica SH28]|uniref:Uncharacterized protein n=1 Tax=Rhodopirellula baltica SH28 TaxID=993517 RepID=K5CEI9_RHOBT|nr:hypothetical protein RBSH_02546 [Rhodopirellula baltica SH28]
MGGSPENVDEDQDAGPVGAAVDDAAGSEVPRKVAAGSTNWTPSLNGKSQRSVPRHSGKAAGQS